MRQLFRIARLFAAGLRTALPGIVALCWLVSSVQAQVGPPVLSGRGSAPATGPASTGFGIQQIADSLQRLTKPGYYQALFAVKSPTKQYANARTGADVCNSYLCTTTSPALSISLTNNGPITCTRPLVALTVTGAPASSTYAFGTGASQPGGPTSSTASVTTAGLFSVTVTAPTGATATAQTTVTGTASLTATISGALTVCAGNTTSLTASGGESFRWSTGATTATISATAGTYSVTATTGSCQATATASVSLCTPANTAPVATTNASQTATLGQAFSYTVNAFADAETPNSLTYAASISPANGLMFNPATRVISGSPNQTGVVSVTITATDGGGLSASTSFSISVQRIVGSTPLSLTLTASPATLLTSGTVSLWASATGGKGPYSYSFSGPGVITQSTTSNVASVSAIPAGVQTFTVLVSDAQTPVSQTASATASVTVSSANTAPMVANAILPQSATVGQAFSYVIPAGTFTDAQTPTSLSLSVSGLPQGLSFTSPSTLSGTPSVSGVSSVTVTATDPGGLSASTVFSLTVSPAPVVAPLSLTLTASPTAVLTTGSTTLSAAVSGGKGPYSYSFSGPGVFAQSDPNVVSVSGLSAGVQTFTVVVRDAQTPTSQTASATMSVTVTAPAPNNTAPTVVNAVGPQSATVGGISFTLSVANTFTDAQTPGNLTLTATSLPAGLSLTGTTISGTPSTTVGSPVSVTLTATDPGGLSASTVFTITVAPASMSVTPTAPFAITGVTTVSCTTLSAGQRSVSFTPQYAGLNGSAVSFSVVNELAATTSPGPYTLRLYTDNPVITLRAVQSGAVSNFAYNWLSACNGSNPTPGNTAPTVANAVGPQSATVGVGFTLSVANTFTDAQTPNSLVLSATGLPAGLSLTGTTISGTPSTTAGSPVSVTLTATDPGGLSASTVFTLTVAPSSTTVTPTPTGPFAITGVTTVSCTPMGNQVSLRFNPQYAGVTGQPISFSVANELSPTTAAGPYTLRLYTDNPVITLSAVQSGVATTFRYNWLAGCNGPQPGNTAPTIANAIPSQSATVGQAFSYVIPANTFTDAQTPNSLSLTVSGLPQGLRFTAPATLSGVPSVSGVSSVTVTATDPGNLSVSTSFVLTVSPASSVTTTAPFAITGVTTIGCTPMGNQVSLRFNPRYSGLTGQPISFSVVNELAPTTAAGPYTLRLYTDNPVITLSAVQSGVATTFRYNWLSACQNGGRASAEADVKLDVVVLGNPLTSPEMRVEVRGAAGQPLRLQLSDLQGRIVTERVIERAGSVERVTLETGSQPVGMLLLRVSTPAQSQTQKVIKAD